MDAIKQWAMSACLAAVVCELLSIIKPSEKLEKTFKITLSLFFLICFLSPVLKFITSDINIKLNMPKTEYIDNVAVENYNLKIKEMAEKNLENKIKILLEKNDINPKKITVLINNIESESIDINMIEITLNNSEKENILSKTENLVFQNIGILPSIIKN